MPSKLRCCGKDSETRCKAWQYINSLTCLPISDVIGRTYSTYFDKLMFCKQKMSIDAYALRTREIETKSQTRLCQTIWVCIWRWWFYFCCVYFHFITSVPFRCSPAGIYFIYLPRYANVCTLWCWLHNLFWWWTFPSFGLCVRMPSKLVACAVIICNNLSTCRQVF